MVSKDEISAGNRILVGMGGWILFPFNRVFYPPSPGRGFRKLEYYILSLKTPGPIR